MQDDRLNRIESKVDKLDDHLGSIDVTLAAQHESLKLHIKRTELLEMQLEPVKKHVATVNGAIKFIGVLAIFASIAEALMKFFELSAGR